MVLGPLADQLTTVIEELCVDLVEIVVQARAEVEATEQRAHDDERAQRKAVLRRWCTSRTW
ncbi:hypothetical protein [Actinomadura miaoliensis]|uniref:Uncharacterized protein n=1 Tax=Actinomadura miaoliensis TaxID=430685 RepID=A0ABP7UX68_9ACTN